jgi:hypothetical protein
MHRIDDGCRWANVGALAWFPMPFEFAIASCECLANGGLDDHDRILQASSREPPPRAPAGDENTDGKRCVSGGLLVQALGHSGQEALVHFRGSYL